MLCMTVGDHEFSINCLTKFSASCNDMAILKSCLQLELQATSIVGYLGKGFGFLHDALIYTIGRETVESFFFFPKRSFEELYPHILGISYHQDINFLLLMHKLIVNRRIV